MWVALFPGQGSQQVGMGRFLFENFAIAKHLFEEASDTLKIDFKKLCFEGPVEDLALTENTQPALLLVSTATYRCAQEAFAFLPLAGAGHSIGEYAALVAAESLTFVDALRAVRVRGQSMQKAVPVGLGAMLAVMGLTDEQVVQMCTWASKQSGLGVLEAANFNSPGQVVISGSAKTADWLKQNSKPELFLPQVPTHELPKLRLIPLNVSAPFHCSMMKPAEEEMRLVLTDTKFAASKWPVVQNFSATEVKAPEQLRENLIKQVTGSVRWTQSMLRLKQMGAEKMIEFGAGKVLTGLTKKIDSLGWATFNINSLEDIKSYEQSMKASQ